MNQLSNGILTLCDTSNIGMLSSEHGEALGGAPSGALGIPIPRQVLVARKPFEVLHWFGNSDQIQHPLIHPRGISLIGSQSLHQCRILVEPANRPCTIMDIVRPWYFLRLT